MGTILARVRRLLPEPEWARRRVKVARVWRERMFRTLGSERYSYPALNQLDRQMTAILPAQGVFLEIGANDGYNQSNTYYLESSRGWRGILVEPIPRLYRVCSMVRTNARCFNVACVSDSSVSEVVLDDSDLTSVAPALSTGADADQRPRTGRMVRATATTLSAVIDRTEFGHVDFMSVDVEGAELAVLGGLDLARHVPSYLLVETARPDEVDRLLGGHMVRTRQLSFHDHLWESTER